MIPLGYILLGVAAGIASGFFGLGGGVILVPLLVWLFHWNQHQAQGLSLVALLLPVGILGAYAYHKANPFPVRLALLISLGIFFGSFIGATYAQKFSHRSLQIAFGALMMGLGLKLILGR